MKLTSVATAVALSFVLPFAAALPAVPETLPYDPESLGFQRNGPLPPNEEQIDGLALNATEYPMSVVEALGRRLKSSEMHEASASDIEKHTFFTKLSAAAYCRDVIPGGEFDCKNCDQSLTLIKTFSTALEDTNVMVLRGDEQKGIYIVFRGTNSVRSTIVDLKVLPVEFPLAPGTKVHKGFLDSYETVRDDLLEVVNDQANKYPEYNVAVTGHSLGGAQALLCGLDLFNLEGDRYNTDTLSIITQGQPRVGDTAFANYVVNTNISYERLVHERDVIPHIPSRLFNFLHAGEEFWETKDDVVEVCASGIETRSCSNSITPFTSFIDHATYLNINTGLCI